MPRPISSKEMEKDVPFKTINTNTKEDAREDAYGKVDYTVPVTHHYSFQTTIEKRYYYDG